MLARALAPPLAGGGLGILLLLPFAGQWTPLAALAAVALVGFALLAWRSLPDRERQGLGSLLRDPRAALRGAAP
jgi:hypothetical protein